MIPENDTRQLGLSDDAEPHGIELEYQRQGTDHFLRQECRNAILTPRTTKQPDNQLSSSLIAEINVSRQLVFSDEAERHGIEYQRPGTDYSSRQESGYAMLTPRTINQPGDQDRSLLTEENDARQLGFSNEAEPQGIELQYQRWGADHSLRQEIGYAMLTCRKMMVTAITIWIEFWL